jgi:hypothetical protein
MGVAGLRREAAKGHLVIETIAGKQFTTLNAIEEMRKQCRGNRRVQDFGSNQSAERRAASCASEPLGLSVTDRTKLARSALEQTARGLSENSPNISPQNISHQNSATVTRLKR